MNSTPNTEPPFPPPLTWTFQSFLLILSLTMSTIPLKCHSSPYTKKHSCSNPWTDFSPYSPMPGPTPSRTAFTITPPPPTEPFANWLPTTSRAGCPGASWNDIETPGLNTGHKAFFQAFLVVVILVVCYLLYNHIQNVRNSERYRTSEDSEPGSSIPRPRENQSGYSARRGGIRRGFMRWVRRNLTQRPGWRERRRRGRGVDIGEWMEGLELHTFRNQSDSEDGMPWGPGGLPPIAEATDVSSLDNPFDADDDEGGPGF
ncbi:hypothetical protein HOY80DRAFT_68152 [Tuber brumale]|nr:hypothetical protein HOY80DRAFT_68152 [Tuber brumale]